MAHKAGDLCSAPLVKAGNALSKFAETRPIVELVALVRLFHLYIFRSVFLTVEDQLSIVTPPAAP